MSIGPPIPEIQYFQNLTLKIKGQGHGWSHSSKSQCGSNILSAHIPFIPCQMAIPILSYDFFLNLTLKIKGQGHGWGHSSKSQCGSNILSIHIPFVPCQSALPFLRYSIFKIWPWKSRVKVKWPWRCTTTGLDNSIELLMVQIHPGVSEIWVPQSLAQCCLIWQVFGPWASPCGASPCGANGQITMTVHNYRSRQVHETLNGVNPSSGFRDMHSAKSGPNLYQIWQVFGPWASLFGANGQMTMTVHNYRPRQFYRTSNGENPSSGYRDMGSASLAAARPPARTVTTIPLQPGGLRGKNMFLGV